MKIFKFGGASVNSVDRIRHIPSIIAPYLKGGLVVIVSAMGKTTNALESVVEAFFSGDREKALQLFGSVKKEHLDIAGKLLSANLAACHQQLSEFFTEAEWLLHDTPVQSYDYYYDQLVCIGELLSTGIVSHYLSEAGIANQWLDARDLVRTDNRFREAAVDWKATRKNIQGAVGRTAHLCITQGFIGSTDENESTTLGREGSDYTAAIFAHALDAESVTIWKDVSGVMNADPKDFASAVLLDELSFEEVIEMAYYGAQVIHPKTIKPLQNAGIPLHVKCFLDPSLPGTIIHSKKTKELPPVIVLKKKQVLLRLRSQDFSFVGETHMASLYGLFEKWHLKPNLIQTGAILVQVCLDEHPRTTQLASDAALLFDIQAETSLTLLSIRHYTSGLLDEMTAGKEMLLMQKTPDTVQVVYRQSEQSAT